MKLNLDPMPALRATAAGKVNAHFAQNDPRAAVWNRKRQIATAGAPYPDSFAQEAQMRGVAVEALAALVLSKPCPIAAADARELARQRVLAALDAALSPTDLSKIVDNLHNM